MQCDLHLLGKDSNYEVSVSVSVIGWGRVG